jgi:peroxiredoxin
MATSLLSVAFFFLALAGSAEAFLHRSKGAERRAHDYYFRKFGIEQPAKRIAAPDFTLEDLVGRKVGLRSLRGKMVFLNFWATWCVPCREEMPAMEKLHREFKSQGLEIVAVNIRESRNEARKFFAELDLTFTALLDSHGEVSEKYGSGPSQ